MAKNIIIGQSGGPTAVINSSLAGVYKAACSLGADKVYGMKYGIEGLLKEELLTPASGRQAQPDENEDEEARTDAVDASPGPDAVSGGQAGQEEKSGRKSERDIARNPRQDDAAGTGRR